MRLTRCLLLLVVGMLILTSGAIALDDQELAKCYEEKAGWGSTMVASKQNLSKWLSANTEQEVNIKMAQWYSVGPIKVKNFSEVLFPENGVDMKAQGITTEKKNKTKWKKQNWVDGENVTLDKRAENSSTYLYRVITSPKETVFEGVFYADDGLVVWLNGKRLYSNEKHYPARLPIKLPLKAGENNLLVKIWNDAGNYGFSTSFDLPDPYAKMWGIIFKEFPLECGWVELDAGRGAGVAWLRDAKVLRVETRMVESVLKRLGVAGKSMTAQMQNLNAEKDSKGRLDLFVEAHQYEISLTVLDQLDIESIKLAVADMMQTFPTQYRNGKKYLARLDEMEKMLANKDALISKGYENVYEGGEGGGFVADDGEGG